MTDRTLYQLYRREPWRVTDLDDVELAAAIIGRRRKAEEAAVEQFRFFVVPFTRHQGGLWKHGPPGCWAWNEANRCRERFWQHQWALRALWAERCRRVAEGDAASCLMEL